MKSITFTCEILTPMFIYGADKYMPELRPPVIKSLMRFWWRAVTPNKNKNSLLEEESSLFGGSGDKNAIKSPLRIRLNSNIFSTEEYPIKPHKPNENKLKALKRNENFSLTLFSPEIYSEKYTNIFFLSSILGGFGKRARRGFGSVSAIKEEINIKYIQELIEKISPDTYSLENNEINIKNGLGLKEYPFIKKIILIDRDITDNDYVLKLIGKASHKAKEGFPTLMSLGEFKPRLSSPVYVSIIKNESDNKIIYLMVVSILKSPHETTEDIKKQDFFIEFLKSGTVE